jgi:dynein assembly factor 2
MTMAHETGQTEFSEDSPFEKPAEAMQGLKNLDLSPDEVGKFQKAFKDPEFMKLFADYAKEISDPAAKAETDQYLRQVEAEGRTKEVYGKVWLP